MTEMNQKNRTASGDAGMSSPAVQMESGAPVLIEVKHLKKQFEEAVPLKDVSCQIRKGDVISIIGPSGTGKSTFINCLNLLKDPTSGEIYFEGKNILEKGYDRNELRKKVGMVFQSFNLFQHLTIVENAMLAPVELLGMGRQEAYDQAMELLGRVGLQDKAYAYPFELSGGQQQRAAIVRALCMKPEVLFFDEPTSALDPTMVGEVLAVIRDLAAQGLTMLIVTHEMKFAHDVSTRVFYMDQGEIYEEGSPDQIFEAPKRELTRRFIRKLKVFEWEFSNGQADLCAMVEKLSEFARKALMPVSLTNQVCMLAEEICLQNLLPRAAKDAVIWFSAEYSESERRVYLTITCPGEKFELSGPEKEEDEISRKLIRRYAHDLKIDHADGLSRITAWVEDK